MSDTQKNKSNDVDSEMLSQLDMLMEFDVVSEQEGPEFFENLEETEKSDDAGEE